MKSLIVIQRNACFGVASGAYDVVLACGVEKQY